MGEGLPQSDRLCRASVLWGWRVSSPPHSSASLSMVGVYRIVLFPMHRFHYRKHESLNSGAHRTYTSCAFKMTLCSNTKYPLTTTTIFQNIKELYREVVFDFLFHSIYLLCGQLMLECRRSVNFTVNIVVEFNVKFITPYRALHSVMHSPPTC